VIPVINIDGAYTRNGLREVADAVTRACADIGFFQIVGFRVHPASFDRVYRTFGEFFTMSTESKIRFKTPLNHLRGYSSFSMSKSAYQECFQASAVETVQDALSLGLDARLSRAFEDIHWPSIAGMRESAMQLFQAERELAELLMSLFAQGLGLAPNHFARRFRPDGSSLACRNYVGTMASGDEEVLPEHTDSGGITLLHQRGNYDGLEIRLFDGSTTKIPVRSDALVVNIGNLLNRWTNGKLKATAHRVVSPWVQGQSRQSIAMFHAPAVSQEIRPDPELVGPEGPRFEPVQMYDLMLPFWDRAAVA
jgi:isopenicillin N synthase-like dioxygenase